VLFATVPSPPAIVNPDCVFTDRLDESNADGVGFPEAFIAYVARAPPDRVSFTMLLFAM
jgi:hypothetical protein